jgi:hypothetical protein
LQCFSGIIANDPDEAIYFNTARDLQGKLSMAPSDTRCAASQSVLVHHHV